MRHRHVGSIVALLCVAVLTTGTSTAAREFTKEDAKAKMEEILAAKVKEGGGVFKFRDERTGEAVPLEFVRIRFVRGVPGHGYIGSMDFSVQGEPGALYDIDVWVKPMDDQLVLMDIKAHRYPKKEGNEWVQVAAEPPAWWWAVAAEHPGETEEKKAWEIKAAMHEHIAQQETEGGGAFKYKDEKTGQDLVLEFVKIHDPVTHTKQGYFACTDFRVKGEPAKLYDLDFWVNEKDGKLVVTDTRIHKEPQKEGDRWIKKPRYGFDKDGKPVEIQ